MEIRNNPLKRLLANAFGLNIAEDLNYFNYWDFSCQDDLDDWVTNVIDYRAAMQQYKKLSEVIG